MAIYTSVIETPVLITLDAADEREAETLARRLYARAFDHLAEGLRDAVIADELPLTVDAQPGTAIRIESRSRADFDAVDASAISAFIATIE